MRLGDNFELSSGGASYCGYGACVLWSKLMDFLRHLLRSNMASRMRFGLMIGLSSRRITYLMFDCLLYV